MKTVILTGGGTAGHVVPALSLLSELKNHFDKIVYIGNKNGIEYELAKSKGLEFYHLPSVKLKRSLTPENLLIPFKLAYAVREAKKLLLNLRPSVIFSKGGYVALPTVISASRLGIPVVCHESDISVGLANKIGAKHSKLFLTSFDCTKINAKRVIFSGSPLKEELFLNCDKKSLIKKYGVDKNKKTVLIFGGSLGSQFINEITEKCLYKLVNRYNIIHICGKDKGEYLKKNNYLRLPFSTSIEELFCLSDIVVSRAGANSLFELTALKKPTLAIPLPKSASRGDQIQNAEYFKSKGMIEVLYQEKANEESFFNAILKTEQKSDELTKSCQQFSLNNPNKTIAELIKSSAL